MHQQALKITGLNGKKKQITEEYIQQDATYIKFKNLQYIQWYMKVEEV